MALSFGFFNSLNGDRKYTADQMSSMFEGLISEGVFANLGDGFQVTASSGLVVSVGSGRAYVKDKWVVNDASVLVSLNAASVSLNRYSAIVLRLDAAERTISLVVIDGNSSSSPVKPEIVRSGDIYDICLAYILVSAGATTITQADIEDTRNDSDICGYVTGLIDQVDTSDLYAQWEAAYAAYYAETKRQLDEFIATLQTTLGVNTVLAEYKKSVSLAFSDSRDINLDMTGYTYDSHDVIEVYFNGLQAIQGTDYTLDTSGSVPKITVAMIGVDGQTEDVFIRAIKSPIAIAEN